MIGASKAVDKEPAGESLKSLFDDYFALMKPRVMSLVIFTALVGMMLRPMYLHSAMAVIALLAIAIGAGASGALNMALDHDIDGKMSRTKSRPIPAGRVSREEAMQLGLLLSFISVALLGLAANWLAAGLLGFTIFFYAVVYTMLLKRRTAQNIVIGGLAGALPPVIGEAAVTGQVTWLSLSLLAIIFLWTPPHFWALALVKRGDYDKVNIPMLPNVAGAKATLFQIKLYGWLCLLPTAAPMFLGAGGPVYLLTFVAANAAFINALYRIKVEGDQLLEKAPAMRAFFISIAYLFGLFAALLVESLLGLEPVLRGWL